MWDDWMENYQRNIGDYRNEIYNTQYQMNMKPNIKCHGVDYRCDKRVYQVNCNFVAIPISMNKESLYKKAEYVQKNYPWLDEEEFEELVHFLNTEIIIEEKPVAEWQEIPKKELTAEEKFEELKNKINKKNKIKREPKKSYIPRVSLVTVVTLMMLLVTSGGIIILKGVIQ